MYRTRIYLGCVYRNSVTITDVRVLSKSVTGVLCCGRRVGSAHRALKWARYVWPFGLLLRSCTHGRVLQTILDRRVPLGPLSAELAAELVRVGPSLLTGDELWGQQA
jgi:hypothetical protein